MTTQLTLAPLRRSSTNMTPITQAMPSHRGGHSPSTGSNPRRSRSPDAVTPGVAAFEGTRRPHDPAPDVLDFRPSSAPESVTRGAGQQMVATLSRIFSLTAICWASNVVLARVPQGWDARSLCDYLMVEHHVHISEIEAGTTSDFLHLAVRPEHDVQRLMDGVCAYAAQHRSTCAA